MNQQQAIERAQQLNAEGKLDFKITHVAKDSDGQWFGYEKKPELDTNHNRWTNKESEGKYWGLNWDAQGWEESLAEVPVGGGAESEQTAKN